MAGITDIINKAAAGPGEPDINISEFVYNDEKPGDEVICVKIGGKVVGSLQNIITITGKPKSRKSTVMAAILAAFISGREIFNIEAIQPEKCEIAYIDTEQSKYDLHKSMQRVKQMAGVSKLPKNLTIYQNRTLQSEGNRNFLKALVEQKKNLKIIFIDGMLDLISDMNNITEASNLLFFLQKVIEKNILLINVLHENKATNFTLGHIGSFLERKSQSLLRVEKDETGSTISSVYMRSDEDFYPIHFYWNYNTGTYQMSENFVRKSSKADTIVSPIELKRIANSIFSKYNYLTDEDLKIHIKNTFPDKTRDFQRKVITGLYQEKIIYKLEDKIQLTN